MTEKKLKKSKGRNIEKFPHRQLTLRIREIHFLQKVASQLSGTLRRPPGRVPPSRAGHALSQKRDFTNSCLCCHRLAN